MDRQIRRDRARHHPPPEGVTGDRKARGSAPRQSRSEASPSVVSLAACCAVTGRNQAQKKCAKLQNPCAPKSAQKASRDQPRKQAAVQSREGEGSDPSPGVGRGSRPLAKAVTAQRGEWRTLAASSGRRGARGGTLVGAWRSQAATVNWPKSVVQTRSWPRGAASAGRRRSRRPAVKGLRAFHHPECGAGSNSSG